MEHPCFFNKNKNKNKTNKKPNKKINVTKKLKWLQTRTIVMDSWFYKTLQFLDLKQVWVRKKNNESLCGLLLGRKSLDGGG